jgi:hypothetical protein
MISNFLKTKRREKQAALDKASFEASHPEVLAKKRILTQTLPQRKALKMLYILSNLSPDIQKTKPEKMSTSMSEDLF